MSTKKPWLELPERSSKPRDRGLTVLIDTGLPTGAFEDWLKSHAPYVDFVKLGWGTSIVTHELSEKLRCARSLGIEVFFGGTLFEKALSQGRLQNYVDFCETNGCRYVEVSNGTMELTNEEKCRYIRELAPRFTVFSEVGYKDLDRSQNLAPKKWIEYLNADLAAGATHVITEARESGKSGICRADGALRFGLIEEILDSGIDANRIVFEAPNKELQAYFVRRVGPNVNLANIPFSDIVGLETLRLGLRSDTFHGPEPKSPEARA